MNSKSNTRPLIVLSNGKPEVVDYLLFSSSSLQQDQTQPQQLQPQQQQPEQEQQQFKKLRLKWKKYYDKFHSFISVIMKRQLTIVTNSLTKHVFLHFDVNQTIYCNPIQNENKMQEVKTNINKILAKHIIGKYFKVGKNDYTFTYYEYQPFSYRQQPNEISLYDYHTRFGICKKEDDDEDDDSEMNHPNDKGNDKGNDKSNDFYQSLLDIDCKTQKPIYLPIPIYNQVNNIAKLMFEETGLFTSFHLLQLSLRLFETQTTTILYNCLSHLKIIDELWQSGLIDDEKKNIAFIDCSYSIKKQQYVHRYRETGEIIQAENRNSFYKQFRFVIYSQPVTVTELFPKEIYHVDVNEAESDDNDSDDNENADNDSNIENSDDGENDDDSYHFLFTTCKTNYNNRNTIYCQVETIQAFLNPTFFIDIVINNGMMFVLEEFNNSMKENNDNNKSHVNKHKRIKADISSPNPPQNESPNTPPDTQPEPNTESKLKSKKRQQFDSEDEYEEDYDED